MMGCTALFVFSESSITGGARASQSIGLSRVVIFDEPPSSDIFVFFNFVDTCVQMPPSLIQS
jgi:hypothetical protein